MIGINHITIAGNLTRDPQTRFLADQRAVANFGLACNRRYKVDGEMREQVTFVDCDCWGRTAETISKHFHKGKPIIVEGRLDMDSWEDRDGGRRTKLKITVERFHFVPDGRRGDNDERRPAPAPEPDQPPMSHDSLPPVGDDDPPF